MAANILHSIPNQHSRRFIDIHLQRVDGDAQCFKDRTKMICANDPNGEESLLPRYAFLLPISLSNEMIYGDPFFAFYLGRKSMKIIPCIAPVQRFPKSVMPLLNGILLLCIIVICQNNCDFKELLCACVFLQIVNLEYG